jgi:hypothetical protein
MDAYDSVGVFPTQSQPPIGKLPDQAWCLVNSTRALWSNKVIERNPSGKLAPFYLERIQTPGRRQLQIVNAAGRWISESDPFQLSGEEIVVYNFTYDCVLSAIPNHRPALAVGRAHFYLFGVRLGIAHRPCFHDLDRCGS